MAHKRRLAWSQRALADLERILSYISSDKPDAAARFAANVFNKTSTLTTMPCIGREVRPGVRELIVHHHYLLTYRVNSDRVEILQVWHTARKRPV
jgi:toxin ParE1/3/4